MLRVPSLVERSFHFSPHGDQLIDIARLDGQARISGPHVGVDGASVPDADAHAPAAGLGFDASRQRIAGDVDEVHPGDLPRPGADPRHHAAGRDIDGHIRDAARVRDDAAAVDGPHAQRDRAMPARGREAIFVPEQDTEICPGVVRRRDEAAVHVGVTTRLETEQLPQPVHCRVGDRPGTPVGDAIARYRDR